MRHRAYVAPLAALHYVEVDEAPAVRSLPSRMSRRVRTMFLRTSFWYRWIDAFQETPLPACIAARYSALRSATASMSRPSIRESLFRRPFSARLAPSRLSALVRIQGGHPARLAMALRSRLQKGHEIGPNAGEPDHARSVRPPARGAYSRPDGRWSRLPSFFLHGFRASLLGLAVRESGAGPHPSHSPGNCSWHSRCC